MKNKTYQTPKMQMTLLQTEDILTLSYSDLGNGDDFYIDFEKRVGL